MGARRAGGRWNSKGRPMIYTSEHLSLPVLETLVHVTRDELPDLVAHEIVDR
ncbi:MAG: RES family NAD+ phosphorylase [Gemmatimonadota bacterium]